MRSWPMAAFVLSLAAFAGCSEEPRPAAEEPVPAATAATAAGPDASKVELTSAQIETLAAEQKVCAVTGEPLGSMGPPEPVSVVDSKGGKHTVLICCEHCREELLKDPDAHLAKLEADKAKATE